MSAGAIGGVGSSAVGSAGRFAELTSEEFINIMLSELANQNPFEPQDSSALLEQLSSLRNIESQLSLQQQLESLVLQNQIASAGGLIGKMAEGLGENNSRVSGLVTSVRVEDDTVYLELDTGRSLAMNQVTQIAGAKSETAG